jgi:chromosome segregation ATPase
MHGVTPLSSIAAALVAGFLSLLTWWLTRHAERRDRRTEERAQARRHSGTVETSEASEVWDATKALLDRLTERLDAYERDMELLNQRVDALTNSNDGLRVQLDAAQQLAADLQREITRLNRANTTLTRANSHLQQMNGELTTQVTHLSELLEQHNIDMKGEQQ